MTDADKPYSPDVHSSIHQNGELEAMDSRLAEAAPPGDQAYSGSSSSEQASLQSELGHTAFAPAVEAQNRLDGAAPSDAVIQNDTARSGEQTAEPAVTGFENSAAMSNEDVQKYLKDTLPADHIRGDRITDIRYPNQYKGDASGVILGECSTNTVTNVSDINIYNQTPEGVNDRASMEYTLTHEVGHNVYYNLAPDQQQQWEKISRASQPGVYVTNYAQTNSREDYAESYAHYVRDPELLAETSQSKFDFMRDIVFKGRQYGS